MLFTENWDVRDSNIKKQAHLLTPAELKRRRITRYDAEIILSQGIQLPEPKTPSRNTRKLKRNRPYSEDRAEKETTCENSSEVKVQTEVGKGKVTRNKKGRFIGKCNTEEGKVTSSTDVVSPMSSRRDAVTSMSDQPDEIDSETSRRDVVSSATGQSAETSKVKSSVTGSPSVVSSERIRSLRPRTGVPQSMVMFDALLNKENAKLSPVSSQSHDSQSTVNSKKTTPQHMDNVFDLANENMMNKRSIGVMTDFHDTNRKQTKQSHKTTQAVRPKYDNVFDRLMASKGDEETLKSDHDKMPRLRKELRKAAVTPAKQHISTGTAGSMPVLELEPPVIEEIQGQQETKPDTDDEQGCRSDNTDSEVSFPKLSKHNAQALNTKQNHHHAYLNNTAQFNLAMYSLLRGGGGGQSKDLNFNFNITNNNKSSQRKYYKWSSDSDGDAPHYKHYKLQQPHSNNILKLRFKRLNPPEDLEEKSEDVVANSQRVNNLQEHKKVPKLKLKLKPRLVVHE